MIIRKEPIQEPVNPRKRTKQNTITDAEKNCPKKTPPFFLHKVDYEVNTNEKTRVSEDSPGETDDCERNMER